MVRLLAVVLLATGCGRFGFGATTDAATDSGAAWPTLKGQWTWIDGPTTGNQLTVYGAGGSPGARDNGAYWAVDDQFYLFGGGGHGVAARGALDDVWRYTPAIQSWTSLREDPTPDRAGEYGIQGVAAPANHPGGRNDASSWVGADGNLYLFGGYGFDQNGNEGQLADLWRFDLMTEWWTWVGGPTQRGTATTADPDAWPSARDSPSVWTVGTDVWMWGGTGIDPQGAVGALAELWRYDSLANHWTLVAGQPWNGTEEVRGTLGVPSPANLPGAGADPCTWQRDGELWLYGGSRSLDGDAWSSVWRYTIATSAWTWIAGPAGRGHPGVYGGPDPSPGSRAETFCWSDPRGNLWVFGGRGLDADGTIGSLSDLWVFQPDIARWTWVSGNTLVAQPGIYGTRGVSDPANRPGARMIGSAWARDDGSLWLFGGDYAYDAAGAGDQVSDLWRFAAP